MASDRALQQEPNRSVVLRLIDFGVLREGGRQYQRLAAALVAVARQGTVDYPVDAVVDHLRATPGVLDRLENRDVIIVADEVVDIVRAHDASPPPGPTGGGA